MKLSPVIHIAEWGWWATMKRREEMKEMYMEEY